MFNQAVSPWSFTAETMVPSLVNPCEICGAQFATGKGYFPSILVFHCQCHLISDPYFSLCTFYSYQKNKPSKPGNLSKINALLEIQEYWI